MLLFRVWYPAPSSHHVPLNAGKQTTAELQGDHELQGRHISPGMVRAGYERIHTSKLVSINCWLLQLAAYEEVHGRNSGGKLSMRNR